MSYHNVLAVIIFGTIDCAFSANEMMQKSYLEAQFSILGTVPRTFTFGRVGINSLKFGAIVGVNLTE